MGKVLSLDIGSSSCKLLLTEKQSNNLDILFYAEKKYAQTVKDHLSEDMIQTVSNQVKNIIRDYKNVNNEIVECNISLGGTNVSSTIIESSLENDDSTEIINQEQIDLLSKNNPKINSFTDKKTAHIIPLDYSLDGMIGIRHPLGMHSKKITVQNLYVNINNNYLKIIENIVSEAGLIPKLVTSEIITSSLFVLNSDEREIGSLIIDIGASSTNFCYSKKGNPILTGALPVGGGQFSSDLAIAFSTNIEFANQLKTETSCTPENERIAEKIIIKQNNSTNTFEVTKRQISQVLKERAVEIFTLIKQEIIETLGTNNLPERVILCGGGSKLEGTVALTRYIFQSKTRLADIKNIKFLGENLPLESMNVISLANYAHSEDLQNQFVLISNSENKSNSLFHLDNKNIRSSIENNVKMLISNIIEKFKKIKSLIRK
ncbi:MAG: cell division protein FtsA [Dehalococcoidia bacterium]|nr:cell division protein FtsA [Dehalococcoidia bacterium]